MGNTKDPIHLKEKPVTVQQILDYPSDLIPISMLKKWKLDMAVARANLRNHFKVECVKIDKSYFVSREALTAAAWVVWNDPRKHQALLLQLGEAIWGKREMTPSQKEYWRGR